MRPNLSVKILVSYLMVILVGVVVLVGTARLVTPSSLSRHMMDMPMMMGDTLTHDQQENFRAAVNEIVVYAALAALAAAVLASTFVARQLVDPIRQMMRASQRIAAGDYHERVEPASNDELGELAHSFNRMAGALEEAEQRRLELIGMVAHELRTPLSGIHALLEGLIDGVLPGEAATYTDMQREVARLQRLVDDLQELSRAEAGQMRFDWQTVDLADLVGRAATRLRPQFEDKPVTLTVHVPDSLPPVQADPDRITQVVLNLIGNALQYTEPGGAVTITAAREVSRIRVTVQDTGVGIAADALPHIFERFYRVDKSRSRAGGGSGIGLTIAQLIIAAHGGQIEASSPGSGQGSTFSFALPVKE
jgi:histidine kinase